MGAEFQLEIFADCSEEELHKKFGELVADCQYEYGHAGYTGTFAEAPGLTIQDRGFHCVHDADDWLRDHAKKWENAMAVRAKDEHGQPVWVVGGRMSS